MTRRWQPQIRAKAKQRARSTDGIVVATRARFGFPAAPGTTDDARVRDITQALSPRWAQQLFAARDAGATEEQLRQIAAQGYRRTGIGRALLPRQRTLRP